MDFTWKITCLLLYVVLFNSIFADEEIGKDAKSKRIMLLRMIPRDQMQLEFLNSLKKTKGNLKIQLWRHPDQVNRHVDAWISSKSFQEFSSLCKSVNVTYEVLTKDFFKEHDTYKISMSSIEQYDQHYHKYKLIVGELKRLSAMYKENVKLITLGKSYEDRDIYAVKISRNSSSEQQQKPTIYLNCGSHAREFLAVSSCKYVIRKLLFDVQYDRKIQNLLDHFTITISPLLNPDGYEFAHSPDSRLWRKTRSPTTTDYCRGVDLNRNFDYRWGGSGSSADPCDEIYCGTKPFSEKESLALARYLYKIRRSIVAYIDVHTYGQLWMSPWGYTTAESRHFSRQKAALKTVKEALQVHQNITYEIGSSAAALYHTSGDSLDWTYGRLGVVHSYGVELRPHLRHPKGFRYPPKAIVHSGEDLLVGVMALGEVLTREQNAKKTM